MEVRAGYAPQRGRLRDDDGQMSVELMVVFPVAVALALVLMNGLSFMASCASFDRVARNAIRVEATAPGYGEDTGAALGRIDAVLQQEAAADNATCSVAVSGGFMGQVTYTAFIDFAPTLFGMGMRDEVFGIALPRLHHEVSLTVDPYHPGMFF